MTWPVVIALSVALAGGGASDVTLALDDGMVGQCVSGLRSIMGDARSSYLGTVASGACEGLDGSADDVVADMFVMSFQDTSEACGREARRFRDEQRRVAEEQRRRDEEQRRRDEEQRRREEEERRALEEEAARVEAEAQAEAARIEAERRRQDELSRGEVGSLDAVLAAAYDPWPQEEAARLGWGCSGYVYFLFQMAGIDAPTDSGAGYAHAYCHSSDRHALRPGMVIGVGSHTRSEAGLTRGHIAIYMGDGVVRDFGSSGLGVWDLDEWVDFYGTTEQPKWGWFADVELR